MTQRTAADPDKANTIHAWGQSGRSATVCRRTSVNRAMVPAFVLWHMNADRPACHDCLMALAFTYRNVTTPDEQERA